MISFLREIKYQLVAFCVWFYPQKRSSRYLEFVIHHHKQDSLLARIRNSSHKVYEPEESRLLSDLIKKLTNPVMLDIGANIGLMSLNVVSAYPEIRIHAFEPGLNQYNFLRKNIYANHLESKITPYNLALGSSNGFTEFFIHKIKDSSGDGFVDTGRGGAATKTRVNTSTLDNWWNINGKPSINVIKLDTEGSELSILKNSINLLETCRPAILIEICHLNYEKYELTFDDHVLFFDSIGYSLLDIKTNETIQLKSNVWKDEQYFLSLPKELIANIKTVL